MKPWLIGIALAFPLPGCAAAQGEVNVLIVYYSATGHTQALAEAVATGARSVGGTAVRLRSVSDATGNDLLTADAVILGSPVYSANVAPQILSFINTWPFEGEPMRDKIGAAFVAAGGISAGEEATQLSILRAMLIFGMIVVGGPEWPGAFGASAVVEEPPFDERPEEGLIHPQFLYKAEALGRRVAQVTRDLRATP